MNNKTKSETGCAGRAVKDSEVVLAASMESGRTFYKKRRCGKVASFFRCLLR